MSSNIIVEYHEDNKELVKCDSDKSSIGSISSADEKDLELLLSGEHSYQFQAISMIKKFSNLNTKS
jgi:hypothetical protein